MTTQIRKDSSLSGRRWLAGIGNSIVDLLFPPYCVACHRFGAWLCALCRQDIELLTPPVCQHCGLPLDSGQSATGAGSGPPETSHGLCHRRRKSPASMEGLRAYAFHTGPLREAIHHFKYKDLRVLAGPLGEMMGRGWETLRPAHRDLDVLVPVPLHPTRQRERGYNQAALLARELGSHLRRPVAEGVLIRSRATAPQVGLNLQARQKNVRDAFQVRNNSLTGKRVLLVDDVCTTGSTLEAGSDALHRGGVLSVWGYTLARAKPGTAPSSI